MSLASSTKVKKFDIRVVEWNLRNGVITKAEYQQYLNELADEEQKIEKTNVFSEKSQDTNSYS